MGQEAVMSDRDELKAAFLQATERLNELDLRVYALQTLLQERDNFSPVDVEHRIGEIRKIADASYQKHLAEAIDEQRRVALRRVLESHEGTKQ
jgi:hypothetical protein